jgi:flagellar hook-length control protein FliK
MQTTPVPILTPIPAAAASPAPSAAARRANAGPSADARQFSQSLSREMEQRNQGPAPAVQPPAVPKPVAATPAKADDGKVDDADADNARDDARDAAAIGPVTDMLALFASFSQPGGPTPAATTDALAAGVATQTAAQTTDLAGAAGKALAADPDAGPLSAAGMTALVPGAGKDAASAKAKPPIGGAAKFAMAIPDGAAAPDAKQKDAALPSMLEGALKPRAAADGTTAAATAANKPDAGGDIAAAGAGAGAKTEAAPAQTLTGAASLSVGAQAHARETVADAAAIKEPAVAVNGAIAAPLQQASLAMAQAIAGAPTDKLAARVGTPGWDNQVGQKIIWMVAGKEQTASLTLNPPDMGPMHVVLSVTGDQASVTFTAAQPEVRQALEAAMPKLREMMGESGIALGNTTVNAGTQDGRQAQQGDQQQRGGQTGATRFGNTGPEAGPVSAAPVRQGLVGGGNGMVDTFA